MTSFTWGALHNLAVMLAAELPGRQSSVLKLLLHMLLDRERGGMLLLFNAVTSCHVLSCVMSRCDVSHHLTVLSRLKPHDAPKSHG